MAVKTKVKLSLAPEIKEMGQMAAHKERRTLSSLVEYLLEQHCPRIIAAKGGNVGLASNETL